MHGIDPAHQNFLLRRPRLPLDLKRAIAYIGGFAGPGQIGRRRLRSV
ncbi:MAG: hypothetical protein JO081_10995 [Alphaproteobacteria bacterium]|nr:hypothetical protein [Alphaproteobacteria bacterium]